MRQLDMLAANFWALKGKDLQELRHLLLHFAVTFFGMPSSALGRANDAGTLVRWHQITHKLKDWNESTHAGAGQVWLDLGDLALRYEDRVSGVHEGIFAQVPFCFHFLHIKNLS